MQSLIPTSLTELVTALAQMEETDKIVAGATDLTLQLHRAARLPQRLLYLGEIPQLHAITLTENEARVGAMATMTEIAAALEPLPELRALADAASDVGSPQVRNKATMAGNLCNASPAGDMLPVCWLLNATAEVLDASGALRYLSMDQLIQGKGRNGLTPDQAVTALLFDRRALRGWHSAFCKIGSREKVSISREGMGLAVRCQSGRIAEARITVGAVATTPLRVPEAEAALQGKVLSTALAEAVTPMVAQVIHDNCRPANRLYKTEAARGLTANVFEKLLSRLDDGLQ